MARKLLTEHEVAEDLNLDVATLRRWRWAKKNLNYLKLGDGRNAAVRYEAEEVQRLKDARRVGVVSDDKEVA